MLIAGADRGLVGDLTRISTPGDSLIICLQTYLYTIMCKMPRLSGGAVLLSVH